MTGLMAAWCDPKGVLRRDAVPESRNDQRRQIAGVHPTRSVGPQLVRRAGRTDDVHELNILVPPESSQMAPTGRTTNHYALLYAGRDLVQCRAILNEANGSFDSDPGTRPAPQRGVRSLCSFHRGSLNAPGMAVRCSDPSRFRSLPVLIFLCSASSPSSSQSHTAGPPGGAQVIRILARG